MLGRLLNVRPWTKPSWPAIADIVCCCLVAFALFIGVTGGFEIRALGLTLLKAHDTGRPLLLAVTVAMARVAATRATGMLIYAAAIAVFVQGVVTHWHPQTGFTDFISFGEQFDERTLPVVRAVPHEVVEGTGYDGQFYAQLALDPLLRDPALKVALDDPGYRARRILFASTAWAIGLGRPSWVLQAYALQNTAAWFVLAWLLLRWFPPGSPRALALWVACLFADGLLGSWRSALVDGPTLVLVVLAVDTAEHGRRWRTSGFLALAGLGRETSTIAIAALLHSRWWRRRTMLVVASQVAIATLPLVLWLIYVRWWAGLEMSAGGSNFSWPFAGYLRKWSATIVDLKTDGFSSYARFTVLALISVTVQAAYLVTHPRITSAWWRVGVVHVLLMAVLGWAVWDGYPGAFTRVVMPMTIAFNVQLMGERRVWPWLALGNLTAIHGLEILNVPWIGALL